MIRKRYLEDDYCPSGYRVRRTVRGVFGDPHARIITLDRRQKKLTVAVARNWHQAFMIERLREFVICLVGRHGFTWKLKCAELIVKSAKQ